MKLKSLDHILVLADDIEATRDFYVDIIGPTVGDRPDFSFPGYWLHAGGHACVHLARRRKKGENAAGGDTHGGRGTTGTTGSIDHIAFAVDDIDDARADLDRRGIAYKHQKVPGAPLQQLFIRDPNVLAAELNFPA